MQSLRSCRGQGGEGCPEQRTPDFSSKRGVRLVAASFTEAGIAPGCGLEVDFGRYNTIFAKLFARICGLGRKNKFGVWRQIWNRARSSKMSNSSSKRVRPSAFVRFRPLYPVSSGLRWGRSFIGNGKGDTLPAFCFMANMVRRYSDWKIDRQIKSQPSEPLAPIAQDCSI
jgi:hypothetical protein